MIKTKTKRKVVLQEEQEDVICDLCGKSCGIPNYDEKGKVFLRFEYMELQAYWGYDSSKDFQYWCAQVCETCVDTRLSPLIKFTKGEYNIMGVKKKTLKRED